MVIFDKFFFELQKVFRTTAVLLRTLWNGLIRFPDRLAGSAPAGTIFSQRLF